MTEENKTEGKRVLKVVEEKENSGKVKKNPHIIRKAILALVIFAMGVGGVRAWQSNKQEVKSKNKTMTFNEFTEESEQLNWDDIFTDDYPVNEATVYFQPETTDLYVRIGKTFYLKYYDKFNGGRDGSYIIKNNNGSGLVTWINDKGRYYIVDADNTSIVILNDVMTLNGYQYFQNYDKKFGGVDGSLFNFGGNGVVLVYTSTNGTMTMVDATDMSLVIASGFTSYINDGDYVVFFYPDGTTSRIHNSDIISARGTLVRGLPVK